MITVFHRLISLFSVIWLTVTITFFALRVIPGDAIQSQLLQSGVSEAVINQRRSEQGLDDPIWLQYWRYLFQLMQGDLGYSLLDGQSVNELLGTQLAPTFILALSAIMVATVLGLLLGILSTIEMGYQLSALSNVLLTLSLSMPVYWTSTVAILIFSVQFRVLPAVGAESVNHLVLPASVLGFHSAGAIGRVVRANIREILPADFVRTAHAKGLPYRLIVRRHILRVALLPASSVIMIQLGFLMSGTVITESIFVRPGLGRLLLNRTLQQDYPVVQGIVVLAAITYIVLNTIADWLNQMIDPRVRVS